MHNLELRPESPADEAFVFALFCASRPDLALLPARMRDHLSRLQFKAQALGFRTQHPAARFEIVMLDGEPIGRLVRAAGDGAMRLVDIAITPKMRGRGIGAQLIRMLMDEAAAADLPVRLQVAAGNDGAQRLYARLGFAPVRRNAMNCELEWNGLPGPGTLAKNSQNQNGGSGWTRC